MIRNLAALLLALLVTVPLAAQSSSAPPAGAGSPQSAEPTTPPAEAPTGEVGPNVEMPERAPAKLENLFSDVISGGLQAAEADTDSSKFEEYRDVPEGIAGPSLRIFRAGEDTRWLLTADSLLQDDRRVDFEVDSTNIGISLFYDQIPHRLGNNARSILVRASRDAWGLSDLAQLEAQQRLEAQRAANPAGVNFAFLSTIAALYTNSPHVFDLEVERRQGGIAFQIFPAGPVDARLRFVQENRSGTRAAGTSFGFSNVVETGEPVDYVTREAGLRLETPLRNGLIRGAVTMNDFTNRINSYTFDNPWRAFDSTDPNAYQAPGAASINGPAFGRIALPPDSRQLTVAIGGVYKFGRTSRLTADLSWAELASSDRLIPYTTNTAIFTPSGRPAWLASTLPTTRFEGDIDSLRATVQFTTRPIAGLNLHARYRTYDLDNQSPRVRFEEGYARFDASWNPVPRITVPYGWTNNRFDLLASYDLGALATVEAGYRHDTMQRTFRETEETTEGIYHLATDLRPFSWLIARASYEFGSREFDHYDPERSEHASFLLPGPPANLTLLRRYDQAERDTQRIVAMLQAMPLDTVVFSANFVRYFDDYADDPGYGLLEWKNQSLTLEADYTPTERWNLFAFWSIDDLAGFQRGRQSGGTLSTNPADDWTAHLTDEASTFGIGGNYNFIPDRLTLNASVRLQQVDGFNNLESPPGGTPDLAFDVPQVDDTRFLTAVAELKWMLTTALDISFGAWFEDYTISDAAQEGVRPYMPGGFFLVPNDSDYEGVAAYVRSTFRF